MPGHRDDTPVRTTEGPKPGVTSRALVLLKGMRWGRRLLGFMGRPMHFRTSWISETLSASLSTGSSRDCQVGPRVLVTV